MFIILFTLIPAYYCNIVGYAEWDQVICPPRPNETADNNPYNMLQQWTNGAIFSSEPLPMKLLSQYQVTSKSTVIFNPYIFTVQGFNYEGIVYNGTNSFPTPKPTPKPPYPIFGTFTFDHCSMHRLNKQFGKLHFTNRTILTITPQQLKMYQLPSLEFRCGLCVFHSKLLLPFYSKQPFDDLPLTPYNYCCGPPHQPITIFKTKNSSHYIPPIIKPKVKYPVAIVKSKDGFYFPMILHPPSPLETYISTSKPAEYIRYSFECNCPNYCIIVLQADVAFITVDGSIVHNIFKNNINYFMPKTTSPPKPTKPHVKTTNDDSSILDSMVEPDLDFDFLDDAYETLYQCYNQDNTICWSAKWYPIVFKVKTYFVTNNYPFKHTLPNIYCANYVPKMVNCKNPADYSQYIYTTPSGKIAFEDGVQYPDPVFLSSTTTFYPTLNSTKAPIGYNFHGTFKPAPRIPELSQYSHPITSCFTKKLQPALQSFLVAKLRPVEHLSCNQLCIGITQTPAVGCTIEELQSPLMQQCYSIIGQIRAITNSKFKPQDNIPIPSYTVETEQTLKLYIKPHDVTQLNLKSLSASHSIKFKLDKLKQLFAFNYKAGAGREYELPSQSAIQYTFDLYNQLMYNSKGDLTSIAVLPNMAAWRFGTQINALSYSLNTLMQGFSKLTEVLNSNFEAVRNAIATSVQQTIQTTNYLNMAFNQFTQANQFTQQAIKQLNQKLTSVEYMTAKLSQFNAALSEIQAYNHAYKSLLQNFKLRAKLCEEANTGCLVEPGVYIGHAVFETPYHHTLIIRTLAPSSCETTDIDNYFCQDNFTHVAPFGCMYRERQLFPLYDNASCTQSIIIPGCSLDTASLISIQATHSPFTDLKPSITPITYTDIALTGINISGFKHEITNTLNQIKIVDPISKLANESAQSWLDNLVTSTYGGWGFMDYVYMGVAILVGLILMPIIILIIKCSIEIAMIKKNR